jgi:hypothetical protein
MKTLRAKEREAGRKRERRHCLIYMVQTKKK